MDSDVAGRFYSDAHILTAQPEDVNLDFVPDNDPFVLLTR
jgi:hypothetical protein